MSYQTGKNVVLTGCTNGIGEAWAYQVVSKAPSTLILVNRNKARAEKLIEDLKKSPGGDKVDFRSLIADLSEPKQVQNAVNEILGFGIPIHVVLSNAGVWLADTDGGKYRDKQTNSEGIEMHVATNFLSMVVLLRGLQENMMKTAKATGENTRCVVTGSFASMEMEKGVLDLENMNCDKVWQTEKNSLICNDKAYPQSKLMQHMWARKFAREVKEAAGADPKIDMIVFDCGAVATNLNAWPTIRKKLRCCFSCIVGALRTPDEGARPGQWAATRPAAEIKLEEEKNGEPGLYCDMFKMGDPMKALAPRKGPSGGFAKLEYYPMFDKCAPSTQNWEQLEALWKQAEEWRGRAIA